MRILSNFAWIALTVTVFLFLVVIALSRMEHARFQQDLHTEVVGQLSQVRSLLESEINANPYQNKGLVSIATKGTVNLLESSNHSQ